MGKEIEHKYLVTSGSYKDLAVESIHILQGYLSKDPERVVRIRITGQTAFLTVKGKTENDTRLEFEYPVPYSEALEMIPLCIGHPIEKIRWIVPFGKYIWEVDEYIYPQFSTMAEIELPDSTHDYLLPDFVGDEVTGNPKYYNSNIG